jgi:hypothetical protein
LVLIVAGVAALVLAGAAQAARKATPAERQGIAAATLPSGNGYYRGGRVAWAVLLDLRHFFAAREPKFLAPGEPGYHACAAKIAYAQ